MMYLSAIIASSRQQGHSEIYSKFFNSLDEARAFNHEKQIYFMNNRNGWQLKSTIQSERLNDDGTHMIVYRKL